MCNVKSGKDRIRKAFQKRKALIPYICAGDPDLKTTEKLIYVLERAGADIIEIGIPFSDPLADGPTIQAASRRALLRGVIVKDVLHLVKRVRRNSKIPLVLMTYLNPVISFGTLRFVRASVRSGVDGVIIADLILEEADNWLSVSQRYGLANIFLAAPTTSLKRIEKISRVCSGFLYYVSVTGTTGAREKLPKGLLERLKKIKNRVEIPIACGFGISSSEQASRISKVADGVIIGSKLIDILHRKNNLEEIGRFIKKTRKLIG